MSTQNLTIVVDGGASGCRLAAFDAQGTLCASTESGPASLSLGAPLAWSNIKLGLASMAKAIGETEQWLPTSLWMGLAGSLQRERYQHFIGLIPTSVKAVVVPDGHAQLIGASNGQPGVCLALGTGSVIHWLDSSGNFHKAGGWGFPVGDEASGAWLGIQLINEYLWFLDAKNKADSTPTLFTDLEQSIGSSVSEIQVWSTSTNSTELASLAPLVINNAQSGDAIASEILERGVGYCKQLIDLAPDNLPLYIVGGLSEPYMARLKTHYTDRIQQVHGNALDGLFTLSKSNALLNP